MTPCWTFHHIRVAVSARAPAVLLNEQVFEFRIVSGPFEDPLQRVAVCFLSNRPEGAPLVELVAPRGEDSPIASYLARGIGAYHTCYEVDDLGQVLAHVRAQRCIIVGGPTLAVAFVGRRIAWVLRSDTAAERGPRKLAQYARESGCRAAETSMGATAEGGLRVSLQHGSTRRAMLLIARRGDRPDRGLIGDVRGRRVKAIREQVNRMLFEPRHPAVHFQGNSDDFKCRVS